MLQPGFSRQRRQVLPKLVITKSLLLVCCLSVILLPITLGLPSASSSPQAKLSYRMAKPTDLPAIAQLLQSTFDDDNAEASSSTTDIQEKLEQRMVTMKGEPHAFLVGCGGADSNDISAFLELGTMPSPIPLERKTKEWNGIPIKSNQQASIQPELPFVANLVVDESMRRQKVGYTMLQLAMKIGTKWCSSSDNETIQPFLFLSVDRDNAGAISFYDRMGFDLIELERATVGDKVYLKKDII